MQVMKKNDWRKQEMNAGYERMKTFIYDINCQVAIYIAPNYVIYEK